MGGTTNRRHKLKNYRLSNKVATASRKNGAKCISQITLRIQIQRQKSPRANL
jgi:hypothetical protein